MSHGTTDGGMILQFNEISRGRHISLQFYDIIHFRYKYLWFCFLYSPKKHHTNEDVFNLINSWSFSCIFNLGLWLHFQQSFPQTKIIILIFNLICSSSRPLFSTALGPHVLHDVPWKSDISTIV